MKLYINVECQEANCTQYLVENVGLYYYLVPPRVLHGHSCLG